MNTVKTPVHLTPATVDDLVLERVAIDEKIARLQEQKDLVNAQLIEQLGDGTHNLAHAKVVISRRGTLDTGRIEAAYPAEQFPQLYATTTKLALDAVKKQFAPLALEEFKTYSAPSVTVKA